MNKSKENQGGRPPRYEGEKSERVAAVIRPRHKRMIEMIANDRQTTVSEAVELAIVELARAYTVSGESIFRMLVDEDAELERSLGDCQLEVFIDEDSEQFAILEAKFRENFKRYSELPKLARKPQSDFCHSIAETVGAEMLRFFDKDKLMNLMIEEFKVSITPPEYLAGVIKKRIEKLKSLQV